MAKEIKIQDITDENDFKSQSKKDLEKLKKQRVKYLIAKYVGISVASLSLILSFSALMHGSEDYLDMVDLQDDLSELLLNVKTQDAYIEYINTEENRYINDFLLY